MPSSTRIRVVLPAPFNPIRAWMLRECTRKSAWVIPTPGAYSLVAPASSATAWVAPWRVGFTCLPPLVVDLARFNACGDIAAGLGTLKVDLSNCLVNSGSSAWNIRPAPHHGQHPAPRGAQFLAHLGGARVQHVRPGNAVCLVNPGDHAPGVGIVGVAGRGHDHGDRGLLTPLQRLNIA